MRRFFQAAILTNPERHRATLHNHARSGASDRGANIGKPVRS
jgi:hypothetical protein